MMRLVLLQRLRKLGVEPVMIELGSYVKKFVVRPDDVTKIVNRFGKCWHGVRIATGPNEGMYAIFK